MKKGFLSIVLVIFATAASFTARGQTSILNSGKWLRFKVLANGVFHIDFNQLKAAGLNPAEIDPARISLYAFPTGMLPQANSDTSDGLRELAISVTGSNDGSFDKDDRVIFYGEGPDRYYYSEQKKQFYYSNNIYADENYYYLTVGTEAGKRILSESSNGQALPTITTYADFAYYETETFNDQKSGREWYGEQFDSKPEITIRFTIPRIADGSEIKIVSHLMAQSYAPAGFKMFWNGIEVLDRQMNAIPETQYGIKGTTGIDSVTISASQVNALGVSTQDLRIQFVKAASGFSVGYLNYLVLNVVRGIAWDGGATLFTIPPAEQPQSAIEVSAFPVDGLIWETTDPFQIKHHVPAAAGNNARFTATTNGVSTYVAFKVGDTNAAEFDQEITNQFIGGQATPHLIIVTHPDFSLQAERLATHRRSHYGIDVAVVTTEQIYNEYSGGRQDISAIRNFIRAMYLQTPGKLKNVLLFGRGSYDYKDRVFNNSNYVPTYESRNSLSPLETYSSDDYYGFLEAGEGEWSESPSVDHTLDIGVGRIPVRTAADADMVVGKLIAFDKKPERYAGWRQEVLFVADDGDFNLHQSQADELAEDIEGIYGRYHSKKFYLDDYEQEQGNAGQVSPKAYAALAREMNKGYSIVNFTGHGSEQVWMQERILDPNTPRALTNNPRLPLLVTATCEFGRNDNPLLISTAELLLLRRHAGAIALVTTTRPVNSNTNFSLNKAFYASFFGASGEVKDLGMLFRETKNNSVRGISNRNFSLLGDPSLRFGPPVETVVATSVKTMDDSDILKALSAVVIEGEVRSGIDISTDFDGEVEVALMDKRVQHTTLGDENTPYPYQAWDHTLFRGKASVNSGKFQIVFYLPVNLATTLGEGKLMMYAATTDKSREAVGTLKDIVIGGSETSVGADNGAPSIELFMGDTTFVNGGYTNTNTYLVGKLFDESGLNISGYSPGNLVATLDGGETFVVNDFFVAEKDDYRSGMFMFPLQGLQEGRHTIVLSARDNHNNEGTASIEFVVAGEGKLVIEELMNYPNPFSAVSGTTTFRFSHNRVGEDLEAEVLIYDIMGQIADRRQFRVPESSYQVTLFEWDGKSTRTTKISDGVYFAKLVVRSLTDGAKNEKIAKLIVVN